MTGRFFALENFQPQASIGCSLHDYDGDGDEAPVMGCDKCYWAYLRKNRPAKIITLKAKGKPPPPPPEEPKMPMSPDVQLAFIRTTSW